MNLRWITLFATVAEERSFTRAAAKLNIAQPWLSAQIRKLEYELGIDLLVRNNLGVEVTEEGAQLLPHALQLAQSAIKFRDTAWSLGEDRSQSVKLGSHMPLIDLTQLRKVAMNFKQRYMTFALSTVTDTPADLLSGLENRLLDLVVIPADLANERDDLDIQLAGTSYAFFLCSAKRNITSLNDLVGQTVSIPPADSAPGFAQQVAERLAESGIETVDVPEYDRRAIEHAVLFRDEVAVLALDDESVASLDEAIEVVPIADVTVEHVVCRMKDRDLGRAAERFWTVCGTIDPAAVGNQESITP